MKLCLALMLVLSAFGSPSIYAQKASAQPQAKVVYSCPMHPNVRSAKKGKCPKCGMDLRPVKSEATTPEAANTDSTPDSKSETSSLKSAKIPNTRVVDQNGKQLNFYDDLIKDKSVAINFLFTTCTAICPSLAA